jgi:hypothetical protein
MLVTLVVLMPRTATEICTLCYAVCYFFFSYLCYDSDTINSSYRYTAVGVFVLGRLFREAWGKEAPQMQAEFNDCLEVFNSCSDYFVLVAPFALASFLKISDSAPGLCF